MSGEAKKTSSAGPRLAGLAQVSQIAGKTKSLDSQPQHDGLSRTPLTSDGPGVAIGRIKPMKVPADQARD